MTMRLFTRVVVVGAVVGLSLVGATTASAAPQGSPTRPAKPTGPAGGSSIAPRSLFSI
jgi:hypothetical protein